MIEQRCGHLRAARVVDAHEQHLGDVAHDRFSTASRWCGTTMSSAAAPGDGYSSATSPRPTAPPTSCAAMNPGSDCGAIPAKVSLNARPMLTAGFANDVDEVNQYAAPM